MSQEDFRTWLTDNQFVARCSGNDPIPHPIEEIDLKRAREGKIREGSCPVCEKSYVSRIRGLGHG